MATNAGVKIVCVAITMGRLRSPGGRCGGMPYVHVREFSLRGKVHRESAVIVLPQPPAAAQISTALRRWLSGLAVLGDSFAHDLEAVAWALKAPLDGDGPGALRLWGQTGVRPSTWVAAADPVYLHAQLKSVVLHRVPSAAISVAQLLAAYAALERRLGTQGVGFQSIDRLGYMTSAEPMPTAALPPEAIAGGDPAPFLPEGEASATFHRWHSEIQMTLHAWAMESCANAPAVPLNALWLWGGGRVPGARRSGLPPLYTDDPLLRGYWYRCESQVLPWPGSFEACVTQASTPRFVAAVPESLDRPDGHRWVAYLEEIKALIDRRELPGALLLFRNGAAVHAARSRWFWPRRAPAWLPTVQSSDAVRR